MWTSSLWFFRAFDCKMMAQCGRLACRWDHRSDLKGLILLGASKISWSALPDVV